MTAQPIVQLGACRVRLSREKWTEIDPSCLGKIIRQGRWFAHYNPKKKAWYAVKTRWKNGKHAGMTYLHRFLMYEPRSPIMVDHINGDGLDNRMENLRYADGFQNGHNKRIQKNNKSGYKGVSLRKTAVVAPWESRIKIDGVQYRSYHATAEEAAHAYDQLAVAVFGELACINFPENHQALRGALNTRKE